MCGLFGAIGKNIYPTLVKVGIEKANTRGPHGCGVVVWHHASTHGYVNKFLGPPDGRKKQILDWLFKYAQYYRPIAILYHARLATVGLNVECNLQPFGYEGLYSVHNGNVKDYKDYKMGFGFNLGFEPVSQSDSEIIPVAVRWAQIVEGNNIKEAFKIVGLEMLRDHAAVIVSDGNCMAGYSKGLPLYKYEVDETTYFCSREIEILKDKGVKLKSDGEIITAA